MIRTVYEDEYLLVVDKPSKLLSVPTPKKETNTLTDILNKEKKTVSNSNNRKVVLYPCHRLDRDTSGLIIYAKNRKVQKLMMDKFRQRKIKKEYIAFVRGRLRKKAGTIRSYIRHSPEKPLKFAITHYKVLRYFKDFTKVLVKPYTGRTNQIRIHFAQLGHPILGEARFAKRKDFNIKFGRTALHASLLAFKHPITKKQLYLHSELPPDLEKLTKI
jgi:23S rRNA pseudouridine1911/1915/1917 synthase